MGSYCLVMLLFVVCICLDDMLTVFNFCLGDVYYMVLGSQW